MFNYLLFYFEGTWETLQRLCYTTGIILRVLLNLTSLPYQLMSKAVDLGGILLSKRHSWCPH